MKIENNQIVVEESDLPFNDSMSRAECYNKGMLDLAEAVKLKIDAARTAKEQHSFMYLGGIFDSLLGDLEQLTYSVISLKNRRAEQ